GLSVWIRFQIATGEIDRAREGILIGLADARHYGRTPLLICKLVAATMANMTLDRLEELIERPEPPNFYWPLTPLPRDFFDIRSAFEFEHEMLPGSVAGLNDLDKKRSPEEWQELAERTLSKVIEMSRAERALPEEVSVRQKRIVELAQAQFEKVLPVPH